MGYSGHPAVRSNLRTVDPGTTCEPDRVGPNRERRRTVPDVRSVFLDTEGRAVVSPDGEEFSCLANCGTKGDWLQWDALVREP